jgi:hypothetical protein
MPITFKDWIGEIADLTQVNDHTGAAIALAEWLVQRRRIPEGMLSKLIAIRTTQEVLGHLPPFSINERDRTVKTLIQVAEQVVSRIDYVRLRRAF